MVSPLPWVVLTVRQHVALHSDFPAPNCLGPPQALPVAYPSNYEVKFEVMGWGAGGCLGWGVPSQVSWPVLYNKHCLPQDPLAICHDDAISPISH